MIDVLDHFMFYLFGGAVLIYNLNLLHVKSFVLCVVFQEDLWRDAFPVGTEVYYLFCGINLASTYIIVFFFWRKNIYQRYWLH